LAKLASKASIRRPVNVQDVTVHRDPFYPNAYVVALPLDTEPCYEWQTIFAQEMWSSLDFWDRKVVVVGRELKLVTTREKMADKLDWLEALVAATNRKIDEYNRNIKAERSMEGDKHLDMEAVRTEVANWFLRKVPI